MNYIENQIETDCVYMFDYPPAVVDKTNSSGLLLPKKELFQMIARERDKDDPVQAAFFREVASHYPEAGHDGYSVDRDGNRNILVDYDDWNELTDEQRLLRGNRNAAIAILDRLRFHLEMMDDNPDHKEKVDEIREGINELAKDIVF